MLFVKKYSSLRTFNFFVVILVPKYVDVSFFHFKFLFDKNECYGCFSGWCARRFFLVENNGSKNLH